MKLASKFVAGLAILGVLVGCVPAGTNTGNPEAAFRAQLRTYCTGYATLLVFFVNNLDRISEDSKQTIDSVNDLVRPVCLNIDSVSNFEEALETVQDGLIRLQFQKAKLDSRG